MRKTEGSLLSFLHRGSVHFLWLLCFHPCIPASAVELGPYPSYDGLRDEAAFVLYRMEKPDCYWANAGLPDAFFGGVSQISGPPFVKYGVQGIEYGLRFSGWLGDDWRLSATVPFEANAMRTSSAVTYNLEKLGDVEIGSTFLITGKRQKGNYIGVDGWFRFPTGTDPFVITEPILTSGRGAPSAAIGFLAEQELWGEFSFIEKFHYDWTAPFSIGASNSAGLPAGTFQWPESIHALGRIEWNLFHRSRRAFTLFLQYQMRHSGLMTLNGQSLSYGQVYADQGGGAYILNGFTSDLFWPTAGMVSRVDDEFTAEVDVSDFPTSLLAPHPGADLLLSLSLVFRPAL